MIEDYAKIPDRLRAIAGTLVGDPRRQLLAIAHQVEEQAPDLLKPLHARKLKRLKAAVARAKLPPLPSSAPGEGQEATNADRSNDERIQETIDDVSAAVAVLQKLDNWDSLGARARIKLIQDQARSARKAKISSQTLYRPWVRDLWR